MVLRISLAFAKTTNMPTYRNNEKRATKFPLPASRHGQKIIQTSNRPKPLHHIPAALSVRNVSLAGRKKCAQKMRDTPGFYHSIETSLLTRFMKCILLVSERGRSAFFLFFRLPPFTSGGHLHGFYNHLPILLEASYNYFDIFQIISTGARTRPTTPKSRRATGPDFF